MGKTTYWRLLEQAGSSVALDSVMPPWHLQLGVSYSMWLAVSDDPTYQICETWTQTSLDVSQVSGESEAFSSGRVGLITAGLTASVPYVVIYSLGPPP